MKVALAGAALLLIAALAACGSDATATEPAGTDSTVSPPIAVPSAKGSVRTAGLVTVMDTGTPALCLGPVAESYPPQCTGPELVGWDWADHQQMFEHEGDVRWGEFAVTGTWDGERLRVTDAVPAALYDPAAIEAPTHPVPATPLDDAELEIVRGEIEG